MMRQFLTSALLLLLCVHANAESRLTPKEMLDSVEIGISVIDLRGVADKLVEKKIRVPTREGLYVDSTWEHWPAKGDGVKDGDIITHVGRKRIRSEQEFTDALTDVYTLAQKKERKAKATITVRRLDPSRSNVYWGGHRIEISVTTYRDMVNYLTERTPDPINDFVLTKHRNELYRTINQVTAQLIKVGDTLKIRLRVTYNGPDWLFIESYAVKGDDEVRTLIPDEVLREVLPNATVCESNIFILDDDGPNFLWKLGLSDESMVRYDGRGKYLDRKLTPGERTQLLIMALAYEIERERDDEESD